MDDVGRLAVGARYGVDGPAAMPPWNETLGVLLGHRSVRAYKPDAPPPGTLELLVAAAQSAATSSNLQAWSVVSVNDPARRARLAAVAGQQRHIVQCPMFLVWVADLSRMKRIGTAQAAPVAGPDYLETFLVASVDAALAAQNAVVAAESLGLSTVYIGALRNDVEAVAAELALPEGAYAVFGLCVGYEGADTPAAVKPRLPQDVVLHHEQYGHAAEAGHLASYDGVLRGFNARNAMPDQGWTDRVLARVGTPKALSGRDAMKAALQRLGFPLR